MANYPLKGNNTFCVCALERERETHTKNGRDRHSYVMTIFCA